MPLEACQSAMKFVIQRSELSGELSGMGYRVAIWALKLYDKQIALVFFCLDRLIWRNVFSIVLQEP